MPVGARYNEDRSSKAYFGTGRSGYGVAQRGLGGVGPTKPELSYGEALQNVTNTVAGTMANYNAARSALGLPGSPGITMPRNQPTGYKKFGISIYGDTAPPRMPDYSQFGISVYGGGRPAGGGTAGWVQSGRPNQIGIRKPSLPVNPPARPGAGGAGGGVPITPVAGPEVVNVGPGGYGTDVAITPRQRAAYDLLWGTAQKAPVDLQALQASDMYKQMLSGVDAQFDTAYKGAYADLAARGMLGTGSTPMTDLISETATQQGAARAALLPQLVNTQLAVNNQAYNQQAGALGAAMDTEQFALNAENKQADYTGTYRGTPTYTARNDAANRALMSRQTDIDQAYRMGMLGVSQDELEIRKAEAAAKTAKDKAAATPRGRAIQGYMDGYDVSEAAASTLADFLDVAMTPKRDGSLPTEEELIRDIAEIAANRSFSYDEKTWLRQMVSSSLGNADAQASMRNSPFKKKPAKLPGEDDGLGGTGGGS